MPYALSTAAWWAAGMRQAATKVVGFGPRRVFIKGAHLPGEPVDLVTDGTEEHSLRAPGHDNRHTHGTGCTLACSPALGQDVPTAVRGAKT